MLLIGNEWIDTADSIEVRNPWNDEVVGKVAVATQADVDAAMVSARGALTAPLSAHRRASLLRAVASRLADGREDVAQTIMRESGKAIRECRGEVDRAVTTLEFSAEEALRLGGEVMPCDVTDQEIAKRAYAVRVPVGVVAAITPFNFPINVAMHKIAPALAGGNAVILKPSPRTPLTANAFGQMFIDAGWPPGWLNILHGRNESVTMLAGADVNAINLTGGAVAGKVVSDLAFSKRLLLELGGNDPIIVMDDADLDAAVDVIVAHRYGSSGQRCTSCKRLFAHRSVFDDLVAKLVPAVSALRAGDPADEATDMGPLISVDAAERVEARINAYREAGGRVLTGGERTGALVQPTVVVDVPATHPEALAETFGPVLPVFAFDSVDEVVDAVNASPVGLQAGVFTDKLSVVRDLFDRLEVGLLVVNSGPNFRIESLPFGSMKEGGYGREGIRFAVEEMTALKTLVM